MNLMSLPTLSTKLIRQMQAHSRSFGMEGQQKPLKKFLKKSIFLNKPWLIWTSYVRGYPETFLVLLNKIVKPEDQEKAVDNAIEELVRTSNETSPLLDALKGKTFRSERLEYIAIQKAFIEGVKHGRVSFLPENICNHAAITPELYADALIVSVGLWNDNMCPFLLKKADRYDLEAVKKKAGYADLDAEFRNAIEETLKAPAPGGTRTKAYDIQTVENAEGVFEGLDHPGIPEDVFNIIGESVALGEPTEGEEGQTTTEKAPEKVASDVTTTSTEVEGSGDIGSERVGEQDQA